MAQSRLEKIGTIFTRVTGLLRTGAMKAEDKPIWFDVYAAFPPKLEPRFDRPAENVDIKNIFYAEDVVRSKYHRSVKQPETVNLVEAKRVTQTQRLIEIHSGLKNEGALDDEKIFEVALDLLTEELQQMRRVVVETESLTEPKMGNLTQSFAEAGASTHHTVDIPQLFKE